MDSTLLKLVNTIFQSEYDPEPGEEMPHFDYDGNGTLRFHKNVSEGKWKTFTIAPEDEYMPQDFVEICKENPFMTPELLRERTLEDKYERQ